MKRKGEVLRVIDKKTNQTWDIDTSKNQIAQADEPGGLTVKLSGREPFVLRRAGRDVFTVSWAPKPAAASDAKGLVRRTFTPGRDPLPVPARGPADAVTVVGDSWRIENRTGAGNFNVLIARVADGLSTDGVLVFRAKVKVEAGEERAWGDLGFGRANEVFPSWDRWPAALAQYDSHTREWTEREVRYPAAAALRTDPAAVYLYAGLHAKGVLYLKDVELLYEPAAASPQAPRLVRTIEAERRFPQTPAFTPDGKALLVAGFDYFAVYDPATGKELFSDKYKSTTVNTLLAVSADGRTAAVACGDLFVYDLAARKRATTYPSWEDEGKIIPATALSLSADGQTLAAVVAQGMWYYDRAAGRIVFPPLDDGGRVFSARYSPDGKYLALAARVEADQSTRISLLDAKTRALIGRHVTTSLSGATLQFSADGQQLFVAGTDLVRRTFLVLDVPGVKEVEREPNLPAGPEAPVPSPAGRLLALTGADGTVQVWDRSQKQVTFAWNPHTHTPPEFRPPPGRKAAPPRTGVAFSPDGRTLATARGDQIRVWDLAPAEPADPKLQGTWNSASLTATHTHVTFAGGRFTLRRSDTRSTEPAKVEVEGTLRLETTTDAPRRFQVTDDTGAVRLVGIYRVEADAMFLCVRKTSKADDYPTGFATDPQTGTELLVLKRVATKPGADRLQGTWTAVAVMRATGPAAPDAVGRVRLTFAGDQMYWMTTDGKVHEGTFKLDPGKRPREIDLVPKQAVGILGVAKGVYSLVADGTGDTLTICIAEPRPGEAQDARPSRLDVVRDPKYVLMTLRREADRADKDRILGTWRGVAAEVDGQPMPKAMIDLMKPTLTFTPDKVMGKPMGTVPKPFLEMAVKQGMLPRETATVVETGVEGVYHLDPAKSPREIDFTILGEVKKTGLGIYQLDGDTLKLSLSIDPAKVSERPREFASKAGEKRVVLTLRRMTAEEGHPRRRRAADRPGEHRRQEPAVRPPGAKRDGGPAVRQVATRVRGGGLRRPREGPVRRRRVLLARHRRSGQLR